MTTSSPADKTSNGTLPADARSAAEAYLLRGLVPIPLPTRAKNPGRDGWENERFTLAGLDGAFPRQQARNIGILNGEPSGNTVDADLDCPQALAIADVFLPPTGWVFGRSGAPRSHRIYRTDRPLDSAQVEFADVDGKIMMELRGTGGLTVFPPGLHKESGEQIAWERFDEPADVALDDLHRAAGELAAAALLARHWPAKGTRDKAAMALSGALLRRDWDAEKVSAFVEAVAVAAGDDEVRMRASKAAPTSTKVEDGRHVTGWPTLLKLLDDKGEAVVRRVCAWLGIVGRQKEAATAKPSLRLLPPYQPFPVHLLPEPLGEYVRHGASALGCDPAYIALPGLSAAAGMIGNSRAIELKPDWIEPSVVWTATVGDSGTLKSPAQKLIVSPLFRLQKQMLDAFAAQKKNYDREKEDRERAKKARGAAAGDSGDPPEEPTCDRIVCSDITIEKLALLLSQNPRGLLLWRDELNGWLNSFMRYKGKGAGSDVPGWLEMFRAENLFVDRKTGDRPTIYVHRAAVSVAGGIQPGTLARAMTPEFLEAGLGARLAMAMPSKTVKQWSEARIDPTVKGAYEQLVVDLLALGFDSDRPGEHAPVHVRLSREAKRLWIEFYNDWAHVQAGADGDLAAAYSKLEAYAARFALLHHVVTRAATGHDCEPIQRNSIEAGVGLAHWFAAEARRIYTLLGETREECQMRRLVEFIRSRGGSVTAKQLQDSNSARYPTAAHADAALHTLVDAGAAEWRPRPPSPRGGRPTRLCVLNPEKAPSETRETSETPDRLHTAGGPGPDPSSETPSETPQDERDTNVSEGFAGFAAAPTAETAPAAAASGVSPGLVGVSSGRGVSPGSSLSGAPGTPAYTLVTEQGDLQSAVWALGDSDLVGIDLETTGLDPRTDKIRLLSLATERGTFLVDAYAVNVLPLFEHLAEKRLVGHNLAFDLSFLARKGFVPGTVHDTMLRSRLLGAGTNAKHSLAVCVERELGRVLSKVEQKSDWAGDLTDEQLRYAALDAEVLLPLHAALDAKIQAARLKEVVQLEERCLPAMVWLSRVGVAFDRGAWQTLARGAAAEAANLSRQLDEAAPPRPGFLGGLGAWNWDSPEQVKEALALLGCAVSDTGNDTLAALDSPLAVLLRRHREARKRCTTYGPDWPKHVAGDGRVYPSWNQLGAASGRMSCGGPNMQQLPRGKEYRRCVAAPPGRVLVKADYSQIELRIAAKVSDDKALLDAYLAGDDLHTRTARNVLGIQNVTKEHRQLAKALNFGLLYGMGAKSFQVYAKSNYGASLSEDEARRYRNAFFAVYPGLRRWHGRTGGTGKEAVETRTLTGRRRLGVARFTEKLNTPVQGTGADGLKLALALLWERRAEVPGAFPVLAVHDEIVVEADAGQADAAADWLRTAMLDAMRPLIDPVPVEVEVRIAPTWGG